MIKKQMYMHLNFVDPKIKILCDLQFVVLSPIPKSKNSEIREILLNRRKTEISECSFFNRWNPVQMTLNSQPFTDVIQIVIDPICSGWIKFIVLCFSLLSVKLLRPLSPNCVIFVIDYYAHEKIQLWKIIILWKSTWKIFRTE